MHRTEWLMQACVEDLSLRKLSFHFLRNRLPSIISNYKTASSSPNIMAKKQVSGAERRKRARAAAAAKVCHGSQVFRVFTKMCLQIE